jgi:hypothetical protein
LHELRNAGITMLSQEQMKVVRHQAEAEDGHVGFATFPSRQEGIERG